MPDGADWLICDPTACRIGVIYTAVLRKVVSQKRKSERDNVEGYYG